MLVQETIQTSVVAAYYLIESVFEIGWSEETHRDMNTTKKTSDTTSLSVLLQVKLELLF